MTAEQTQTQYEWTLVRACRYSGEERVYFRKPLDSQSHIWVHWLTVMPGVSETVHLMFKSMYTDARGDVWHGTVLSTDAPELVEIGMARHIWIDLCSRRRDNLRTPVWIPEEPII